MIGPSERYRLLLEGQNRALQLANDGAALRDILEVLVRTAESLAEGSFLASILLLDEDGRHLRHGAAPSLPDAYNEAIDGLEIGPNVGSCGTAAHFGHAIVVTDIERNPLWADYRGLALQHGLRACWSTPFLAKDGSVLGTLALYYREPRGPTESDRNTVKMIGNAAAIVLENARLQSQLRQLRESSPDRECA
jgi:GAF domain-containing protein